MSSLNYFIDLELSFWQVYMQLFTLSFSRHAQNIKTQQFLLRKSLEIFDTDIMKNEESFNAGPERLSYEIACILRFLFGRLRVLAGLLTECRN